MCIYNFRKIIYTAGKIIENISSWVLASIILDTFHDDLSPGYHNFNIINIQMIITLKIMVISLRILYHFYLEFQDKFKSFVKFGLNTWYNKLKI